MSTSTKPSSTRTLTAMTNTINIPTHSSGMAPNRIRIRTCTKPPCTGTPTFRTFITGIRTDETAAVTGSVRVSRTRTPHGPRLVDGRHDHAEDDVRGGGDPIAGRGKP